MVRTGKTKETYVPNRGDIIWLWFDPQAGHEQAGRQPAVVLSPLAYNAKVGLVLVCPITSKLKGYPFEVPLPANLEVTGAILADQIKSLDWRARHAELAAQAPPEVVAEVLAKLQLLIT